MSRVRKHALALAMATCALLLATAPARAQEPTVGQTPTASLAETASAQAQPAAPSESAFVSFFRKTEVAGTFDTYFHYNFNDPETGSITPLRNFDFFHNQFSFALAELAFSKPPTADDPVGFRLDLDYGSVTDWVHSVDPAGPEVVKHFQQAYVSYMAPVGTGLTFDFGKFVTQHGAEVIEAKDNWNYSRSLLFAWAIPYYHMGMRVGYSPNDKVTLGASVNNGWNNTDENNSGKTYGVQGLFKPTAAFTTIVNYMSGPEQIDNSDDWRHLFDITLTYALNDVFSVMGNYDYGHDTVEGSAVSWQGVGVYLKAQATPYFAVIPRYEYYNDEDGFTTGDAQNVQEFTLTAEFKHSKGFFTRLEYRRDWSDIDFFEKDGLPADNQNTFSIGFVYSFSTK
ncbi:MAG TPA: porin [Vicinamibacterales bacterium]|nr:porin [Vicinamibacterales bacterium]